MSILAMALVAVAGSAGAQGGAAGQRGRDLARRGDCLRAVPLLEEAQLARHTPATASALAGCYVALGELIRAAELYDALAREAPSKPQSAADRAALAAAAKEARQLEARIPVIMVSPDKDYPGLAIEIDGAAVGDPAEPLRVPPYTTVVVTARATGYRPIERRVVVDEGVREVIRIHLDPDAPDVVPLAAAAKSDATTRTAAAGSAARTARDAWFGGRMRGFFIPKFLMNAFGDGGTDVLAPGASVFYTMVAGKNEFDLALQYTHFGMGPTPYRPAGAPDSEWEIIDSDLMAFTVSAEIVRVVPLDDAGIWSFRIGGGIGVGWMFAGDLHRTQAYPPKGTRADPDRLKKCEGPNSPAGTYAYCNQLDKDADHYGDFAEPSWFEGGARPVLYPWATLPKVGLTARITSVIAIDLEAGASLTGFLGGLGVRYGL